MPKSVTIGVPEHLSRACAHLDAGDVLSGSGNEWAAVCYFYAAYHLVRKTLRTDPIFADVGRLQSVHRDLIPDDRENEHHKGRIVSGSPRNFGVTELVDLLYKSISVDYNMLYQASVQVRYASGLRLALSDLRPALGEIFSQVDNGLAA